MQSSGMQEMAVLFFFVLIILTIYTRLPWAYIFQSMTAKAEQRNWAELPTDVLSVIYQKLGATEVLLSAQAVCRSWWQLSMEPHVWRSIELFCNGRSFERDHINKIAQEAIIRSRGHVEQFFAAFIERRDHIHYDSHTSSVFVDILASLANRTTGLRRLILIFPDYFDENRQTKQLVNLVGRFPLLEELHISNVVFPEREYTALVQSCSKLKHFRLNRRCEYSVLSWHQRKWEDCQAEGIANNMAQLQELQLIGHNMTAKGLLAILDKCASLESLDIRECFYVDIDVELKEKLHKIKTVRLPLDSKEDEYDTGVAGDIFTKQCGLGCCDDRGFNLTDYLDD